jgi:fluoride ion exporter CrcB/FEX
MAVIPDYILTGALLGALGGVSRVCIGVMKFMSVKYKIYWGITGVSFLAHAIVGALLGAVFHIYPEVSLLAGYGGLELLDSIYKAFKTQKVVAVPERRKR